MNPVEEYERQAAWRDWSRVFEALPSLEGRTVVDIGCATGAVAAALVARGARVIGLDTNDEFLAKARSRGLARAEFRHCDAGAMPALGVAADGLWSSFSAAYFTDLPAAIRGWAHGLRPGGWIALTEVDDLLGQEPVRPRTRELLDLYARDALADRRYDFHMGSKLQRHVVAAGFTVARAFALADPELAFDGPARPEVVDAWRQRLDRMKLLHAFCGAQYDEVRDDFIACLSRSDHRSTAAVRCCVATH
jgi:SAM-dependent methyltransferase